MSTAHWSLLYPGACRCPIDCFNDRHCLWL